MGNINLIQLIQSLLRSGGNPQQIAMNILQEKGNNNPILQNAMNLAQNGNTSALLGLARNLAQQRGLDFDKEFSDFQSYLK